MREKKRKKNGTSKSRREFLKTLSALLASSLVIGKKCPEEPDTQPDPVIYGPRNGLQNPYVTDDGKPILVCVEGGDFIQMLQAGLNSIGGLARLVDNNQDVLIKPNLVEPSMYPWVSDLDSIIAIIQEVQKVSSGDVMAGDMSYYPVSEVYSHLNFTDTISNAGGTPLLFSDTYKVRRNSWPSSKPNFSVYSDVYNAPVIINFPVLKRHELSHLTCAIKCHVGTIQGPQTTGTREYIHKNAPDFKKELAELPGLVNPELNVVDARTIVTDAGPLHEQGGILVQLNKIVICGDIVATDAYCAQLLAENDGGFSESDVDKTLSHAEYLGLGTSDLSQVEIKEISL